MKPSKFLFSFLLLVLTLTFISAQSGPHSTIIQTDRGVDIVHPETQIVKDGTDLEINFWTYNSTNGATLTNSSLNCTLYIVDNTGNQYYRFSNQAGASGLITYGKGAPLCVNCWTMTLPKENLTLGTYSYQIKCQGSEIGGYYTGFFEVTSEGISLNSIMDNPVLLFLLIVSFILILVGFFIKMPSVGFIGSMSLIIAGMYTMIYGLNYIVNFYTRTIAIILIGVGVIFSIVTAYEGLSSEE